MAQRFEALVSDARAWLNTPSGLVDQTMTMADVRERLRMQCLAIENLFGEAQPCGIAEPHLAVCTSPGDGRPVAGVVVPEEWGGAPFSSTEARQLAAMLLRAADEAES